MKHSTIQSFTWTRNKKLSALRTINATPVSKAWHVQIESLWSAVVKTLGQNNVILKKNECS